MGAEWAACRIVSLLPPANPPDPTPPHPAQLLECMYTRILAAQLQPRGIAVNAVCPGARCPALPALRRLLPLAETCLPALSCPHNPRPLPADALLIRPASPCRCPHPPGWCSTSMSSFRGPRPAAEGADTPAWLALEVPEFVTGQFWRDRKAEPW